MDIKYEIKGITLNMYDLIEIHKYYEAACTAEYLMDNYDIAEELEALELGYEVRELIDRYGYDEEEASEKVMSKREEEEN